MTDKNHTLIRELQVGRNWWTIYEIKYVKRNNEIKYYKGYCGKQISIGSTYPALLRDLELHK